MIAGLLLLFGMFVLLLLLRCGERKAVELPPYREAGGLLAKPIIEEDKRAERERLEAVNHYHDWDLAIRKCCWCGMTQLEYDSTLKSRRQQCPQKP